MGTSDSIVSLAMLAGLAYGAYYLISNNMIPGINVFKKEVEEEDEDDLGEVTEEQEVYEQQQFPIPELSQFEEMEEIGFLTPKQRQKLATMTNPQQIKKFLKRLRRKRLRKMQQQGQGGIIPPQYQQQYYPPAEDYGYQTAGYEQQQQMPQVIPPTTTYLPQQYQYPQQYPTTSLAGPPGSVSSIQYMQTPSGPPYVSPTVNTYSQYSPYNQFYQYEQKWTPSWGVGGTWPDDNTNFTDIRTDSTACVYCKNRCRASPYGSTCRACRMSCKKTTYQNIPAKQYWDIGVPGSYTYTPYGSYLAMVHDTLFGKPTFLEMDNYRQSKRFDPHNKLKRKMHPRQRMNHEFVSREDYWDNPTRINFNLE